MVVLPWFRRPFFLSVVLGLLGFFLAPFGLEYSQPPFNVNMIWSFVFPLTASMAFGWKYGLVAGTLGLGAIFPFELWIDNGWAVLFASAGYLCWYTGHGFFAQIRKQNPRFWNHPLLAQVPLVLLYVTFIGLGFPLAFSFNPPFWYPAAALSMAPEILGSILVKDIVALVFTLFASLVFLKLNPVRRLLGLEIKDYFRNNSKLAVLTVLSFSLLWYLVLVFTRVFMNVEFSEVFFFQGTPMEVLSAFIVLNFSFVAAYILIGAREGQLKAEALLVENQARYRESLNSLPVGVGILSKSGEILFVNRLFTKTFGYTLKEIPDMMRWTALAYPDPEYLKAAYKDWSADLLACEADPEFTPRREYLMRAKDESFKQVEVTTRAVGETYFCTFADVTDQHRLIEAAQRNQKLEALGLLAGGIAHDFNNLLAGIFGNIQMALLKDPGGQSGAFLETCMKLLDRSRGLTKQLLTFAKGGAPEIRTEYLFPFLKETTEFALSGSGLNFGFNIDGDLWACSCDKAQIAQVMDNLVINARQALGTTGSILVSARNLVVQGENALGLKPGDYVKFSLTDDGPGIDPTTLGRIFDPFFTTKPQGHGLGLATCHSIVKKHGGDFEVSSHIGEGTTFSFYLPAVRSVISPEPAFSAPIAPIPGGRILVVDDEPYIRDVLEKMLTHLGYEVQSFPRGEEALDMIRRDRKGAQTIKAAILDLTIPGGKGGKDLAQELREMAPWMVLFLISGYAEDPLLTDYEALGVRGTLKKPFDLEGLRLMLEF